MLLTHYQHCVVTEARGNRQQALGNRQWAPDFYFSVFLNAIIVNTSFI
jgi:hypothetical protein